MYPNLHRPHLPPPATTDHATTESATQPETQPATEPPVLYPSPLSGEAMVQPLTLGSGQSYVAVIPHGKPRGI